MTSTHKRAIGIFPDRPRAASALQALSDSGFDMKNVSVIARDSKQENPIAGVDVKGEVSDHSDDGGKVGVLTGGVLGGVTGLLIGLGTLTIPGIGPVIAAGEVGTLLTTLVGGSAGALAGGLVGALIGLGIPEHRAKKYRDRVAAGDYLVLLRDTDPEISRAEKTLKAAGIEDWGVYSQPYDESQREHTNGSATSGRIANGQDPKFHEDRGHREYDSHSTSLPHASNPVSTIDRDSREDAYVSSEQTSGEERRALGVFQSKENLEDALTHLKQTGFPVHMLSILVRESESNGAVGEQMHSGHPLTGAANLASGLNHIHLPQVGPTVVMGPDADALSAAIERDDSSSVVGVMKDLGIAEESAHFYSRHLENGAYLVTLRGQNSDVMEAASTLGQHGMRDWGVYNVKRSRR